jgi:hypothetical protein
MTNVNNRKAKIAMLIFTEIKLKTKTTKDRDSKYLKATSDRTMGRDKSTILFGDFNYFKQIQKTPFRKLE